MADCECLPKCPFFHDQMEDMPAVSSMIKRQYCQDARTAYSRCARHKIFEKYGRESVPVDLFPVDLDRAHAILEADGEDVATG